MHEVFVEHNLQYLLNSWVGKEMYGIQWKPDRSWTFCRAQFTVSAKVYSHYDFRRIKQGIQAMTENHGKYLNLGQRKVNSWAQGSYEAFKRLGIGKGKWALFQVWFMKEDNFSANLTDNAQNSFCALLTVHLGLPLQAIFTAISQADKPKLVYYSSILCNCAFYRLQAIAQTGFWNTCWLTTM